MRPNLYGITATAPLTMTSLPAQNMDAIAVHFPQPVIADGRLLPAGNHTVSMLRGMGELPLVRFQSESGDATALMVMREYLPLDEVSRRSEVVVVAEGENTLRLVKIAVEGLPFLFVVNDLSN